MVSINYSAREVCCKIVYYGPGLSGKTTNLQYVHGKVPTTTRGDLISLATEADRTLYFDFLPINIGTINGFQAKFQLYTVPGQVYYNATRKLVLRGVDGVVFVADSQPDKMDENVESLANLVDNLQEYGYDLNELPMVLQYNKRDLPNVLSVEELNNRLNTRNLPYYEASAVTGGGVFDTLKLIIKLVLEKAKSTAVSNKPTSSSGSFANTRESGVAGHQPPMAAQPSFSQPTGRHDEAPALHSSQRIATAPIPQAALQREPERISTYRPYPGGQNVTGGIKPDNPVARPDRAFPGASTGKTQIQTSNITADQEADVQVRSSGQTPTMAPPLKRRGGSKKRGLFKRLFGIK